MSDNIKVTLLAEGGEAQILFCHLGPIRVREIVNQGGSVALPTTVTVERLNVPTSRTFDVSNALVTPNGNIQIMIDDQTRVEPKRELAEEEYVRAIEGALDRLAAITDRCEQAHDDWMFWHKVKEISPFFVSQFRCPLGHVERVRLFLRFERLCEHVRGQDLRGRGRTSGPRSMM